MAHERSITVGTEKGFFNIVTVIRGKRVSDREAFAEFERTGANIGGPFDSVEEAVKAAKKRSDEFKSKAR